MAISRRTFLLSGLAASVVPAFAQGARNIGEVRVEVSNAAIAVRVAAGTAELQALAQTAFRTHGRYRLVASGQAFDFKFTPVAANQVRVDIARGAAGTPVHSETVAGSTVRQALLRAADVAVARTNGLGLRGYFSSRIAFVSKRTGRSEVYVSDLFFRRGAAAHSRRRARAVAALVAGRHPGGLHEFLPLQCA
jgi:TolB protein